MLTPEKKSEFTKRLATVINSMSLENESDTPDFILASYLVVCFENFTITANARREWYGDNK